MSISSDVKASYLGYDTGRSASTRYAVYANECWFRGATVLLRGYNLNGSNTYEDMSLKFHNGDSASDVFLEVGVGVWFPDTYVVVPEDSYIPVGSGIYVSSDDALVIRNTLITVFRS